MKSISVALQAHIAQEVTTLCTCWKLTRRDNVVFGFTDHDADIVFASVTYIAATGFLPSAIQSSSALAVDNLDVDGILDSATISEEDIHAGKFDFAEVEIFKLNYTDTSQGKLSLKRGWIGEVALSGGKFTAEIRGLTQKLSQTIGELYSPSCRARLGDTRCKVNLVPLTKTGSVTLASSRQLFEDSSRTEDAGYFSFGKITFTTGLNSGLSMEVKEYSNNQITLVMPLPFDIEVGDSYTMVAGCDKVLQTCVSRFGNAVNFRGEPHVPGTDKMLETAGTRSKA